MSDQRIMALLGLAQKAGKIVSGEVAVEHAVRAGKAKLILVAADASDNTRKNYFDMAKFNNLTCHEVLSKDQFGTAIGKPPRAALAVNDAGFSKAIKATLLV
jgi:ribosomal protein L7Ae-like RNA K-turn-binding protein